MQQLSHERIADAAALLGASRWSAAYYVAGYSVECALKSCLLAYVERTGIIFEDKKFAEKCWTHDIDVLVKQAEFDVARGTAIAVDSQLGNNWLVVKDWTEASRYRVTDQQDSQKLFDAISDHSHGVLQWIKQYS